MKTDFKIYGLVIVLFLSLAVMGGADKHGKYSKKANEREPEKYDPDIRQVIKSIIFLLHAYTPLSHFQENSNPISPS